MDEVNTRVQVLVWLFVKKIVEHHGGVIYATGEPDVGATFTMILPVTEE